MIRIGALGNEVLGHLLVAVLTSQRQHGISKLVVLVDVEWQALVSVDIDGAKVFDIGHLERG